MKKLGLALAFIWMLAMVGCGRNEVGVSQPQETVFVEETGYFADYPFEELPIEPGNTLVEYEPNREIYIACQNQYKDLYANIKTGVQFIIFSKRQIETEDIQVSIPTQTAYTYSVVESFVDIPTQEDIEVDFPKHLYYCYCDYDFQGYYNLWKALSEDGEWTAEDQTALDAFEAPALAAYQALTPDELPEFYYYLGYAHFTEEFVADETITEMEFIIEGISYVEKIGQITLHTEALPVKSVQEIETAPFESDGGILLGNGGRLYNQGTDSDELNTYYFQEDTTLTGFYVLSENCDIQEITIRHTSNDQTMEYIWDGQSPINAYAGDELTIGITYSNPYIGEFWQGVFFIFELDYESNDQKGYDIMSYHFTPALMGTGEAYERYALVFDGVDLMPAYKYKNYGE